MQTAKKIWGKFMEVPFFGRREKCRMQSGSKGSSSPGVENLSCRTLHVRCGPRGGGKIGELLRRKELLMGKRGLRGGTTVCSVTLEVRDD